MSYWNSACNRASAPNIYSRGSSVADARERNATTLEFTRQEFNRRVYRVLLAHDLTGRSEIAFVRAARLTLEREGHLTILHVISSELPAAVIEAQRARAKIYLETEVRRWLARHKLSYHIDIGVGDPASAIAARAQAHDVNLVVAGRHRRRALVDTFIAATVERLLRQMQRPTLVVSNSNQSPYRRVLIPIDFTDASAARIQFAATFLPQASLHLLHTYKRRFQDYVAPPSLTFSQEDSGEFSRPIGQQPKQALSRLIETLGLGERRPLVTIENGDALAYLPSRFIAGCCSESCRKVAGTFGISARERDEVVEAVPLTGGPAARPRLAPEREWQLIRLAEKRMGPRGRWCRAGGA
jgi:nucleotide-binding universal stress UspA family protein